MSSASIPVIPDIPNESKIVPLEIDEQSESVYEVDNIGCWGDNQEDPKYGPINLPNKLVITTICGTLYARDRDKKLVWVRYFNAPLFDKPQMVGNDLVVIAADLKLIGLDPKDGRISWSFSSNGRAFYSQLVPFTKDSYLVLVDMSKYDDAHQVCLENDPEKWDKCPRSINDELRLMHRDAVIDDWFIPAHSKIEIERTSVYVTYRKGAKKERMKIRVR